MEIWPKINLEYLGDDQVRYEADIRGILLAPNSQGSYATPQNIRKVQDTISRETECPSSISYDVTSEEQLGDFTKCKGAVKQLLQNTGRSDRVEPGNTFVLPINSL